ncbi:MAG: hypothetical protein AMXMBFR13_46450 [Phycisphaerae bacterium]
MTEDSLPAPIGTTTQRVERKYPLPTERLNEAVDELTRVVPIFRYSELSEWSSIRTTYLDSLDFQCYQEYLQDLPIRRKIRIRQYGVAGKYSDFCWFELKLKNGSLSLKRRFRCALDQIPAVMKGDSLLEQVQPHNTTDVRQAFHLVRTAIAQQRLLPVVRVEYERLSFQDATDSGLRITLDRDVRFCSSCRRFAGELEGLVLEVKHNGDRPDWLPGMRERLELKRALRFSKFGRCMKALQGLREIHGPR